MGLGTGCCKIVRTTSHRPQVSFFPFFDRISRLDRYRRKRTIEKIANFISNTLWSRSSLSETRKWNGRRNPSRRVFLPGRRGRRCFRLEQNPSLFLLTGTSLDEIVLEDCLTKILSSYDISNDEKGDEDEDEDNFLPSNMVTLLETNATTRKAPFCFASIAVSLWLETIPKMMNRPMTRPTKMNV